MTAEEIKLKVRAEIGDGSRIEHPPAHWVDLKRCLECLVEPELREFYDTSEKKLPWKLWVVFEEDPLTHKGYSIVYDESEDTFGLAMKEMLIGLYGTFLETLNGM